MLAVRWLRTMMRRRMLAKLEHRAKRAGLELSRELTRNLEAYFSLLSRWNARINLTSLGDEGAAVDRLVIEPLVAARYVGAKRMMALDVGSGGGSPAIPLKLARPRLSLTMVESKTRKAAFLREAVRSLALDETGVETARDEELLLRPEFHEAFALVTIRAVRIEKALLGRLQAFLAPGGRLLLFRGPSGQDVPSAVSPPLRWVETVPLVESLRSRLVILEKRPVGHAKASRIVSRETS